MGLSALLSTSICCLYLAFLSSFIKHIKYCFVLWFPKVGYWTPVRSCSTRFKSQCCRPSKQETAQWFVNKLAVLICRSPDFELQVEERWRCRACCRVHAPVKCHGLQPRRLFIDDWLDLWYHHSKSFPLPPPPSLKKNKKQQPDRGMRKVTCRVKATDRETVPNKGAFTCGFSCFLMSPPPHSDTAWTECNLCSLDSPSLRLNTENVVFPARTWHVFGFTLGVKSCPAAFECWGLGGG